MRLENNKEEKVCVQPEGCWQNEEKKSDCNQSKDCLQLLNKGSSVEGPIFISGMVAREYNF